MVMYIWDVIHDGSLLVQFKLSLVILLPLLGNYTFTFGNNSLGKVYNSYNSNASWTRSSDERKKKEITENTDCGLNFINDLRTVTYKWKSPSEFPNTLMDMMQV